MPDPNPGEERLEQYWRSPAQGPRILFFSGGSALRGVARALKRYTWNSVHIVTPFDSGGSSAEIRRAFGMLSVGDLRNRLLALADEGPGADPALFQLMSFRLPGEAEPAELRARLSAMVDGGDPLIDPIAEPARTVVRELLGSCAEAMPDDFDLRHASVGNLVLAGGYLREHRDMATVLQTLSDFVGVRGVVRPVTEDDLQLGATLVDGTACIGQHNLTGKEVEPIASPIEELFLTRGGQRTESAASPDVLERIARAELIVYPMGSFFSSVLCNLLPAGVGRAIVESDAPKIYLPNAGRDPEQLGMFVEDGVQRIVDAVRADAGDDVPTRQIVSTLVCDRRDDLYGGVPNVFRLALEGIEVVRMQLSEDEQSLYDPERVVKMLLSFA
ncbi:MAG: GAK system CofD-like protein [Planctomycetota bacterium]